MTIFGKSLSEYISFQKVVLILFAVVGLLRLGLSLGGVPNSSAKWLSLTILVPITIFYYPIRSQITGFGTYKNLLPLYFIQTLIMQAIISVGIVIAIVADKDNIYSAPEFYHGTGTGRSWGHVFAHIVVVTVFMTTVAWLISSLVLFVASKTFRPRTQPVET